MSENGFLKKTPEILFRNSRNWIYPSHIDTPQIYNILTYHRTFQDTFHIFCWNFSREHSSYQSICLPFKFASIFFICSTSWLEILALKHEKKISIRLSPDFTAHISWLKISYNIYEVFRCFVQYPLKWVSFSVALSSKYNLSFAYGIRSILKSNSTILVKYTYVFHFEVFRR